MIGLSMSNILFSSIIITFIVTFVFSRPCLAQLGLPQTGVSAPPALNFYRVAIIPKISFQSKTLAKYAAQQLNKDFPAEGYKFTILQTGQIYKVAFLIKIMFFDRDEAVSAINFLKANPNYDETRYELQI